MTNEDIRWQQRFANYCKAFSQIKQAVDLARQRKLSELERQGLIQAFEYTHELAWKTMKDFLESRGNASIYGSRDATREAFKLGLIQDGEVWMDMIKNRNRSSHTYNEATAEEIANAIVEEYLQEFETFQQTFEALKNA